VDALCDDDMITKTHRGHVTRMTIVNFVVLEIAQPPAVALFDLQFYST
jgi:hypothetical protein